MTLMGGVTPARVGGMTMRLGISGACALGDHDCSRPEACACHCHQATVESGDCRDAALIAQVDILNGTALALTNAVDDPGTPSELLPGLRLAVTVIERTAERVAAERA
jgi:hypothetical protein